MVLEPEPKTFRGWSRSPKFGFRLRSPALNDMKSTACEMLARCKFTSQYAENTQRCDQHASHLWREKRHQQAQCSVNNHENFWRLGSGAAKTRKTKIFNISKLFFHYVAPIAMLRSFFFSKYFWCSFLHNHIRWQPILFPTKSPQKFWKKSICCRGVALWKEIEQSLKNSPRVAFCMYLCIAALHLL